VYRVEHGQPPACIVRIRRLGEVGFRDEAWAIEQYRAAGVPVPALLLVDTISCDPLQLEVMVQEEARGQPLSHLLPLPAGPASVQVHVAVGAVLASMHRVEVGGFGRRQPDGGWAYSAWPAFVAAKAEKIAAAQGQILRAGFSQADVDFMMATVLGLPDQAPCATPVLCHGDFVPEHVFVTDDLRISSVIDFGQIHGAPPLADLIHLSFLQPTVDLESVKGGYSDRVLTQHGFERQLHLQRLLFLLPCVAHITATGNPAADKTPDAVGQLRETLAALRRCNEVTLSTSHRQAREVKRPDEQAIS
jgi:aminoglycoside phosphotransferase (APT) family kinase protein